MLKYTIILTILFQLGLSSGSRAQSPVLEAYIQEGLKGNLSLQEKNLDIEKARETLRQANALFWPKLTFDANYTVAAGGRKIDFPIGDLLNPVYSTLNQLTQSNAFPVLENQEIQFLPHNFQETKLSFSYPLYNTDLKYNKAIQSQIILTKTASKAALEQSLRYSITEIYLQFLQTQSALKIWDNTKLVLVSLKKFNESLVKNNVATRDIVATADYEISKADGEIAKLNLAEKNAKAYFNFLINKPLDSDVVADTTLLKTIALPFQQETLVEMAFANRAEFDAIKAGIAAAETNVKRNAANAKYPDLYIGGSIGFQGFGYKFNQDQAYGIAQIGLSYDLFDKGMRSSKTQESRIEALKAENSLAQAKQQISLQVTTAWNALVAAQEIHQTTAAGITSAESVYKIVNNKYRAGQALLIELVDAQNRVTVAQIQQLLAWTDVLVAATKLKNAVGQSE